MANRIYKENTTVSSLIHGQYNCVISFLINDSRDIFDFSACYIRAAPPTLMPSNPCMVDYLSESNSQTIVIGRSGNILIMAYSISTSYIRAATSIQRPSGARSTILRPKSPYYYSSYRPQQQLFTSYFRVTRSALMPSNPCMNDIFKTALSLTIIPLIGSRSLQRFDLVRQLVRQLLQINRLSQSLPLKYRNTSSVASILLRHSYINHCHYRVKVRF